MSCRNRTAWRWFGGGRKASLPRLITSHRRAQGKVLDLPTQLLHRKGDGIHPHLTGLLRRLQRVIHSKCLIRAQVIEGPQEEVVIIYMNAVFII